MRNYFVCYKPEEHRYDCDCNQKTCPKHGVGLSNNGPSKNCMYCNSEPEEDKNTEEDKPTKPWWKQLLKRLSTAA